MNNKKLYRIEEGKVLAGVCGGVAEYFNMDPVIVRVLWVAASLFAGGGLILYIVMVIIVPVKSEVIVSNVIEKKEEDKKESK